MKSRKAPSLLIQRSSITPKNVDFLFKQLTNTAISSLSLCDLRSFRPSNHLTDFLANTPRLCSLDLSSNSISVDLALTLSQGLVLNCLSGSLKTLNLNHNNLGSKGTQLLCEALKGHSTLEALLLNDNGIDTDGAFYLNQLL
jgi:hypothetical protein